MAHGTIKSGKFKPYFFLDVIVRTDCAGSGQATKEASAFLIPAGISYCSRFGALEHFRTDYVGSPPSLQIYLRRAFSWRHGFQFITVFCFHK